MMPEGEVKPEGTDCTGHAEGGESTEATPADEATPAAEGEQPAV